MRNWYVAIEMWTIYNSNIEVVFFVIDSGRKITMDVKLGTNVKEYDKWRSAQQYITYSTCNVDILLRFNGAV